MSDEVLFSQEGALGVITLNRAHALNALTLTMILAMQRQLSLWRIDDSVHAVVVRAAAGNAFCAGGDVRALYLSGQDNSAAPMQFFLHEYRLNHFIHHFNKPYISLIDGIVMGGGVGISLHGSHPVASERLVFAMPETSIGFFPDIGASYLLTRCPESLGIYLGLTGNRLAALEALKAGLIKKIIPSQQMPALFDALMNADLSTAAFARVDQCLQDFSAPALRAEVEQPFMNHCFAQPTVAQILDALEQVGEEGAKGIAATLAQKSPLSLKVTLSQLQQAKGLTLAQCLQMDYGVVRHFMQGTDFYEGVRALLIDKDKNPQWNPGHLDLVTEEMVQEYFQHSPVLLEWID